MASSTIEATSPIILAIDGTSSSGKGTLSKKLAVHFGFDYLDTGLIYRKFAFYAIYEKKISIDNHAEIIRLIGEVDFANGNNNGEVFATEEIGNIASKISLVPDLRAKMNDIQKSFTKGKKGVVADGRDMGTVVFPDANFKLYIDADIEIRAKRRYKQLQNSKKDVMYTDVLQNLKERDLRDKSRNIAPLLIAEDAIFIDSTNMDSDTVFDLSCKLIGSM